MGKCDAQSDCMLPGQVPLASFDVVVIGGGLAGQTVARQIKRVRPSTKILVTELRPHPVKEAAYKVGESTVEIGAHYFSKVLDCEHHLIDCQLRKAGLRFFFPHGTNENIASRVEMGASYFPPVPSYQLDRGRFENTLAEENVQLGIEFWDRCKAVGVMQYDNTHYVRLDRDGKTVSVSSKWIVDASGRAALLKRHLGLSVESDHRCNAVWFRIADSIDPDNWSDDPDWRARVPHGLRLLSTNHFMGRGYWVWLIPLPGGVTSVGIVADSQMHPLERMSSFERALGWLKEHEPQCAHEIQLRRDKRLDFLAVKHYAHGCARVFSGDRWALTGDSGVFTDPFYSPGSDFIAMSNTFITDLIVRDIEGDDVSRRADTYNRVYLNIYESFLKIYRNQYSLMGNAQVMAAKIIWDFAVYWGFLALRFLNGRLCDLELLKNAGRILEHVNCLNTSVQEMFRKWDERGQQTYEPTFIDALAVDIMQRFHYGLIDELPGEALLERFSENLALCNSLANAFLEEYALPVSPLTSVPASRHGSASDLEGNAKRARENNEMIAKTMQKIRLVPVSV